MTNYISWGKYYKLYIYIWMYIVCQLLYEYLYGSRFPEKIKINYLEDFPKNILIQEIFNYLSISIFSFILFKYELNQIKLSKKDNPVSQHPNNSSEGNLIYNEYKGNIKVISIQSFCFVIFLLVLSNELKKIFDVIGLKGLDFWMFEILFITLIYATIFKIPIYKHKKIAIFIIIFFPIAMKIMSLYEIMINKHQENIYKKYYWIIAVGIISFLIIILIRAYAYCKIKWFFDLRYISAMKLLVAYGIIGTIICLIGGLISTNIQCINKAKFDDIEYICNITENGHEVYYDHFHIFFKSIWEKNKWYILFELIEVFLYFLINLFLMLIIKNLNPEFLICSKYINYFIIELLMLIEEPNYIHIFELLSEFFAIIGFLIYLELIECRFCKINYNLKKNIIRRSIKEIDDNIKDVSDFSDLNSQSNLDIE